MLKFSSIGRKAVGAFARPTVSALAGVPARAFSVQSVASAESLSKILKAEESKTIVIDWYADWCGPCRQFAPTFDKISNDAAFPPSSHLFLKANVEEVDAESLPGFPAINAVPTFHVIKAGQIKTLSGANEAALLAAIKA